MSRSVGCDRHVTGAGEDLTEERIAHVDRRAGPEPARHRRDVLTELDKQFGLDDLVLIHLLIDNRDAITRTVTELPTESRPS
jgi:hypothetical protein